MGKSILLLVVTNILVMITLSVVMAILQAAGVMPPGYIGYSAVSCLIWGFGVAFISLFMSKMTAKWMTGATVLEPGNAGQLEWVVNMVHQQARSVGLSKMPEVAVYESPEMNAFATGPSRSNSLVAFSSGIIRGMSRDELEGVSAHEVAHISNGDMLTMTLLQGIANAFVFFFSRMLGRLVASRIDSEAGRFMVYLGVSMAAQIVFMLLASIPLSWFSRRREFRADADSAQIAGREKMVGALKALKRHMDQKLPDEAKVPEAVAALAINNNRTSLLNALFASHPPLDERIRRLQEGF